MPTTATDADPGDWMIYQGGDWDHIPLITPGTDLGIANRDSVDLDVTSSTGNDVTIPAATASLAGLMTAADKDKLDDIPDEGLNDGRYLRIDAGTFDQTVLEYR